MDMLRDRGPRTLRIGAMLLASVLICATLIPLPALWGQTTAGSISGQVTDASGAAVPGAKISVTNKKDQEFRTATSAGDGTYNVPSLFPGVYHVSATAQGFSTVEMDDVRVPVDVAVSVNLTLQVGAVTERVEVKAAAPLLETANTTIGEVVDNQKVVQLPLNGRQFTQLILLTPGAAYIESGQQSLFNIKLGAGGISPSVNGQNSHHNNFTLDGLENNARFDNTFAIAPPPDAIDEFKVQSHIADARFGLAPGANVNVATKSGANEFHGDVWEFLRNDKLDARNFFDLDKLDALGNKFAPTKPAYRQNQYGFTVGGPVMLPHYDGRKSNTYFFGYYEGFHSRKGFTNFSSVPTAKELGGDFSDLLTSTVIGTDPLGRPIFQGEILDPATTRLVNGKLVRDPFSGNMILPTRINASALLYAQTLYPAPNFGGGSLPNLIWSQSQAIDSDQFGVRLDHRFHNNDTIFGRFSLINTDQSSPLGLPTTPLLQQNYARQWMLAYTHLFSPSFLLNFKTGYLRARIPVSPKPAGTALVDKLGFDPSIRPAFDFADRGTTVGPQVNISPRFSGISQWGWGLGNPDYNYQYNTDLTKVQGHHTLFGGLELLHWRHLTGVQPFVGEGYDPLATGDPSSQLGGDGLASYLLGLPTGGSQFGFNPTNMWGNIYIIYLQDDWKVSPKLTLNLGLQYDYAQRPHFFKDQISTVDLERGIFRWATTNPFTGQAANVRKTLFDPDWNNFAPRIGIAYQLTKDTVIRTGFGVFYAHSNELIQEGRDTTSQWPFGPLINQNGVNLNNGIPSGQTFTNPLPSLGDLSIPRPPNFGVNVTHFQDPKSLQWNLGVQRILTPTLGLEVDYVGSANDHLFIQPTANTAVKPGPGDFKARQPFPALNPGAWDTHVGRSNYHSLQTKITKRFSQGLSFLGAFTWGRSFDIGTTRGSQAQDFYNINDSYGPSDYDVPRHLVLSYIYDLPFGHGRSYLSGAGKWTNGIVGGWQITGITRYSDGTPFSISAPFDVANTGGGSERASLVPGQQLLPSGLNQTPDKWFNTGAVTIIPFTYGNLSRNIIRGPRIHQWDVGAFKNFNFSESRKLEFRAESFNLSNAAQFGSPDATATSPTIGRIFSTRFPNREIQFALKFYF